MKKRYRGIKNRNGYVAQNCGICEYAVPAWDKLMCCRHKWIKEWDNWCRQWKEIENYENMIPVPITLKGKDGKIPNTPIILMWEKLEELT
ncbi:MAG: hypothetical protein FWG64_09080 [Firmicutes bacterium]|nr:hypothetical protein [Bacillota bacterium]